MNWKMRVMIICAVILWHSAVLAASVGIGTNPQGSLGYSIAAAVAKVITEKGGIETRAVGMGGSSVFIPQVNSGEIAFGTSNTFEAIFATTGGGNFSGTPNPNLRVVAALVPFTVGIMVRADSDIKKITDLKGKRFPSKYARMKLVGLIQDAVFKAVGMSEKDIRPVPVPNFVKGSELLAEGKVVGVLTSPASGVTKKTNALVAVRFLNIPNTPQVVASMSKSLPSAYLAKVKPSKRTTGILEPIHLVGYQYAIVTNAGVAEDVVYKATKATAENKKSLAEAHGVFNRFVPKNMVVSLPGAKYHPGAIKYYKERGWWPPAK